MVTRVPEEELMDCAPHAQAYANVDFSEPNRRFVGIFAELFPTFAGGNMLDLGCGPADIPIRFARRYPNTRIAALDGAGAMVEIAQGAVARAGLDLRISVSKWHIGREASPVASQLFDAVVSNSLLHHMSDPVALWTAIRCAAAPGACVLVMDLFRPSTRATAEEIVDKYAADDPPIFRQDFLNSLLAAYQPDEIRQQIDAAGLACLAVETMSDRHVAIHGVMPRVAGYP